MVLCILCLRSALRVIKQRLARLCVFSLLAAGSTMAMAGETVKGVNARGHLRCGVSEGIQGFSIKDAAGRWTGLDVDLCRAVAAAVLDDPNKVQFVPLKASARFPALQAGRVDLLARNTTWTMTREVLLKVQFPGVLFYDGQGFMVPVELANATADSLRGSTVCVEKGTTHAQNLLEYFAARGAKIESLVIDSAAGAAAALFAGKCRAYSSDASQLAALRLHAPGGPQGYVILPERISKEPLAPVVRSDDAQWVSVVRWVLFGLINAEERGITRSNVATTLKTAVELGTMTERAKDEWDYTQRELGLKNDWALQAIKAVGNYGEMFERNLGAESPLKLDRGLNRLWSQGGLMYGPPLN